MASFIPVVEPSLPQCLELPVWVEVNASVLDAIRLICPQSPVLCCRWQGQVYSVDGEACLALASTGQPLADLSIQLALTTPLPVIDHDRFGDPYALWQWLEAEQHRYVLVNSVNGSEQGWGLIRVERLRHLCLDHAYHRAQAYQELLDRSPDIIERFDANLRHQYVSAELTRITGIPATTFLNKTCRDLGLPTEMVALWEAAAQSILATKGSQSIEFETQTLKGPRWFEMSIAPEWDLAGNLDYYLCISRDITDRKLSDQFNRAILEVIPDLLAHFDRDGNYLNFFSTGSMRVLKPEVIFRTGANIRDVLPPQQNQVWLTHIDRCLETQSLQIFEQCLDFDGEKQYEEVRIVPMGPGSVLAIIRDVSERKKAETALQKSEARFRNLVANIPGAVFQYLQRADGSNAVTYMSPACWHIWEVPPEDVVQDSQVLWAMVHPEDLTAMAESVRLSAMHLAPWICSWRVTTPSGQQKWLQGFGQPQRLPNGDTLWDSMIIDVTESTRSQLDLKASEAQLSSILDAINGVIKRFQIFPDFRWQYQFISKNAEKVLGFTAAVLDREPELWLSRIPTEDVQMVIQPSLVALSQGQDLHIEFRFRHRDQRLLWISNFLSSQWDPDQQCWQVTCLELDITERKLAEERVKEQQVQLDLVVQTSGVGFYVSDLISETSYVSPSYKAQLGYPADAPEGSPSDWNQRLHPDDRAQAVAAYRAFRRQEAPYSQDFRLRHRDGSYRWIHSDALLICDHHNQPIKVIGTHLDITDRKLNELALQLQLEQAKFLNRLVRSIQYELDLPTIFTIATRETGLLIGVDRVSINQFQAESGTWQCLASYCAVAELADPLDLALGPRQNTFADRLKQGETVVLEMTGDPRDPGPHDQASVATGTWLVIPIHTNGLLWGAMVHGKNDAEWQWQAYQIDLAQQVADHLSLSLQQAQLSQQLHTTNEELRYQVDIRNAELQQAIALEQLLRQVSEAVRSSLVESEILQETVDRLADKLSLKGCLIAVKITKQDYEFRYQSQGFSPAVQGVTWTVNPAPINQLQQGDTLYFSTTHPLWGESTDVVCPIRDGEETLGFLRLLRPGQSQFTDAEIRLAEQVANQCAIGIRQARLFQQAQEQVQKLQELNRLKDEFLHMVSHELRTPLASMKMALTMLEINPNPEAQSRYLGILRAEWNRELALVNELLELQALESGTRTPQVSHVHLPEWIQSITDSFYLRCSEKEQNFEKYLYLSQTSLYTDHLLLERILLELLNNACKYTPAHEKITLTVNAPEASPTVLFQVTNTGVTIPIQEHTKIFEKFHRIPSLDCFNQGGTGLGLALVKKAVESLRGQIWLTSYDNVTSFSLHIPVGDWTE
ncbi:MAG: hypothetical protein OHK0012_19320 [Synechococcales cyanobacterium]